MRIIATELEAKFSFKGKQMSQARSLEEVRKVIITDWIIRHRNSYQ